MILSDYLELKLLDRLLKEAAYAQPALYFALFTVAPTDAGGGTEVNLGAEGAAGTGGYTRASVTNNNTNFPQCSITGTPAKTNATTITFPTATAAWGTVTHWAVYDANHDGNLLAHGALASTRYVALGDSPKFAAGTLSITATNISAGGLTTYAQRKLLDHVFGGPVYIPAATIHTGLMTAYTSESVYSEWDNANYARQITAFDSAEADGFSHNTAGEVYSDNVAGTGATLTHFGVWDDVSAGNLLAVGSLATSRTVAAGDAVTLPIGALTITLQ